MRSLPVVLLFLTANLLAEPTASEKYRYAPFLAAAKLWNQVRYLHPRVIGDSTTWDAALIAALPKIQASRSDDELALALDGMLATLHDPCTRIAMGLPGKGQAAQAFDADTLVIRPGTGTFTGSLGPSLMLRSGLARANSVVWDLRGNRMAPLQGRVGPRSLLLSGLGYAYRQHSGFPPQTAPDLTNNSLGTYFSSEVVIEPIPIPATKPNNDGPREVFLVDKNSSIPVKAILEQINGLTAIISEDPPAEMQAGITMIVPLLGSIAAEIRVAELRYPDGTTEFAPNRVVLNRGAEAIKAAASVIMSDAWGMPGARPKFELTPAAFHEMPYSDNPYPSRELRILAAVRIWGIMHYFHPTLSLPGNKWDDVFIEFLPKLMDAKDAREYHLAVAEMMTRANDVHCLADSPETRKVFGTATQPFEVRFIENEFVVTQVFPAAAGQAGSSDHAGARLGDVIVKIDGKPVRDRVDELTRYLSAHSTLALMSRVSQLLIHTSTAAATSVTVQQPGGEQRSLTLPPTNQRSPFHAHHTGEPIRVLDGNLGYVDLERIDETQIDALFEKLASTSAIILDLRGFPRPLGNLIAARLGNRDQPVAAEFVRNLVAPGFNAGGSNPDVSYIRTAATVSKANGSRYAGKTVALIDEISLAGAADSALFLKAASDTVLIGRPASGSFGGDVTQFMVPGGIRVSFSGQGVRLPDGKDLYPAGLQPDVKVEPTVAGIAAGRDEILDQAIVYLSHK